MEVVNYTSPNFGERAPGLSVNLLLIHYTGMKTCDQALQRLCDPSAGVSSHYLISETGSIYKLVDEAHRAWHAGVSFWQGETDINSLSIGIELVNPGHDNGYQPFPEKQMLSLIHLCGGILQRHNIPQRRVLGHSDVSPGRKRDPGELFDWRRLAASGVGYWPREKKFPLFCNSNSIVDWQSKLKRLGYNIEASGICDSKSKSVVTAFQRHWVPKNVSGVFDNETSCMLERLIADIK